MIRLLTAAVLTSALPLLAACDQPKPKCNIAHGAFWAKYTLIEGDGPCAELAGEELDVQSYYAPRSSRDQRPDYDNVSLAIQPFNITSALWNAAGMVEANADDLPYALGRIRNATPEDDYCNAPELSIARLRLPEVPEYEVDECTTAPAAPAYDLTYEFSDVRVYYTAAASGTRFEANLRYTQDDCTAEYKVSAVYPMVGCGMPTPLEDGEDAGEAEAADEDAGTDCPPPEPPTGPPVADDSLCQGAGINPDFAVACDPAAMMCILAEAASN